MILDTGFIIDLMKEDSSSIEKLKKLVLNKENYEVSTPTIFELYVGIALSRRSEEERNNVLKILSDFVVVPLSLAQAEKAGEIHGSLIKSGQEIDVVDSMIAGIALLENETILTRNVRHFSRVKGLRVESY